MNSGSFINKPEGYRYKVKSLTENDIEKMHTAERIWSAESGLPIHVCGVPEVPEDPGQEDQKQREVVNIGDTFNLTYM